VFLSQTCCADRDCRPFVLGELGETKGRKGDEDALKIGRVRKGGRQTIKLGFTIAGRGVTHSWLRGKTGKEWEKKYLVPLSDQ